MLLTSNKVATIGAALATTYYSVINTAIAQDGGLQNAAETTGNDVLNLLLAIMPIIMIILLVTAALMLASRKFGLAWIGSVLAGAFVAGKAEMFLEFVGVTVTTTAG